MSKHSTKEYEDENDETIVKNINLEKDHQPNNSTDDHHPAADNDNDDEKLDEKRKKKKKKSKDRDREKKHRDGSREKDKEKVKDKERDREKDKEKEKTSNDNNKIEKRHRADSPIDKVDNNDEEPRKKRNLSRDRDRDRDVVDRDRRRRSPSPAYRRRSPSPRRRYDSRDRDRKDRDRHGDREKEREKEKSRPSGDDKEKTKVPKDEEESVLAESSSENLEGKSSEDKVKSSVVDDESTKKTATTGDKMKEATAREAGSSRDRERDRRDRSDKDRNDRDRGGGRSRRSPSPRYRRRSPSPRSYRQRSPDRRDRDYDRRGDGGGGYRGGSGSSRRSGRSSERDRNRERSKDREDSRDRDRKKRDDERSSSSSSSDDSSKPKPLSLKDIISAYPGISIAEAAQRLNAHNSALALGLPPPNTIGADMAAAVGYGSSSSGSAAVSGVGGAGGVAMMGNSMGAIQIAGLGGLVGEGGALTKPHRELYVGNIPPGTTVPQLADFLNAIMKQLGLTTSTTGCIITAWVSTDGHYAFVEFRTIEETLGALQYLNGLQIGAHVLKVGRPKGYNSGGGSAVSVPMGMVSQQLGINMAGVSAAGAALGSLGSLSLGSSNLASIMGSAAVAPMSGMSGMMSGLSNPMITTSSTSSSMFNNGINNNMSNVIMVTNLPLGINEEQVRELVSTFGEIQAFNLIKTADTAQSAVLEYVDKAVTDDAILGLNKLEIANYRLAVQRVPAESAAILLQPIHSARNGTSSSSSTATTAAVSVTQGGPPVDPLASLPPTRLLRLSNMTVDEDLIDDELYEELKEDIAEECGKYGDVQVIIIPRLTQYGGDAAITDASQEAAVGQIFLQYSTVAGAEVARKAVAGRSFNGKIVLAYFYPEELFAKKIYVLPAGYFNSLSPSATQFATAPVSVQQQVPQPSANPMEDPDSYFNDIDEMD